jgi:hypothetical protein
MANFGPHTGWIPQLAVHVHQPFMQAHVAGPMMGPVPPPPRAAGQLLFYTPQPHPHARVRWVPTSAFSSEICHQSSPLGPETHYYTFHLFSKLPIELRLKIWAYAVPRQRVIEIRSWGNTLDNSYTPIKFSVGPHQMPAILHATSESRKEGLRIYKRVQIGLSTTILDPNRAYVDWKHHPMYPRSLPDYPTRTDTYPLPLARPYRPQELYVDFSTDIIYLGPEFQWQHLESFLTTTGQGFELSDLQYLALDRKLWLGCRHGRWDYLRNSLYSLSLRPVKEIYIIPDDEHYCLEDRYYYKEHKVEFHEPMWTYSFWPAGQTEYAKTALENLGEWFQRWWLELEEEVEVPRVKAMSVRRSGRRMGDFRNGIWEVQMRLGDMRFWKTWVPPVSRS